MSCVKNILGACAAFSLVAGVGSQAVADAGVGLDVASAYVFRGAEVSDDVAVFGQAEVSANGFTVNTWAWWDTDAAGDTDIGEVDLTLTYALPTEAVDLSVGVIEYLYPASGGSDREVVVALGGKDIPLNPVITAYFGLEGSPEDDLYVTLGISHVIDLADALDLELGALAAYWDDDSAGESGIAEGNVSAALSYALSETTSVGANVAYSTNLDDKVLTDAAAYDDVYGGVSFSHAM